MSDEITIEAPRVTVGFERKVNLGNYESATGSIFIQVPTAPGESSEQIAASAKLAFADAKATVYEQLGITMDVIEGVVVEQLGRTLGAEVSSVGAEQQAAAAAGTRVNTTSTGGSGTVPTTTDAKWDDIVANPKGWFDNRTTKTGKQPDFKRKGSPAPGEKYPPSLWADKVPEGIVVPEPAAFQ